MILSGKPLAKEIRTKVKESVTSIDGTPKLVILLIGDNEASKLYVNNKKEACAKVGIDCEIRNLESDIKAIDVVDEIQTHNMDDSVTGILLQSPVSDHLHFQELANLIHPHKDVDGLTLYSTGMLAQ